MAESVLSITGRLSCQTLALWRAQMGSYGRTARAERRRPSLNHAVLQRTGNALHARGALLGVTNRVCNVPHSRLAGASATATRSLMGFDVSRAGTIALPATVVSAWHVTMATPSLTVSVFLLPTLSSKRRQTGVSLDVRPGSILKTARATNVSGVRRASTQRHAFRAVRRTSCLGWRVKMGPR